ncbi:hypothetical protein PR002_g20244 [Phytophthora rubi]|uniref:Uncharacterized protein n=2 Tax=Phytophthora rubi TaxID=129364 RepID=A0A6A3JMP3_9STRA|nr:hypothetical protein PR002_g20244 [Phytophthora rubi]
MGRSCIISKGKRRKQYKRVSFAYGAKKAWLDYLGEGHTMKESIAKFCGLLSRQVHGAKEMLLSKRQTSKQTLPVGRDDED